MLDGILGRGFASKCKPTLRATKNRIDIIRRKRNATQKFLKKDIADLLANGLDINAYGRAEGLLVELNVSSCYDFVEQSCDFLLKHLLILQKLSSCPEDCREAVSSLMYAAARFSDLPELRDLRQMLQEKYGNSLENFVNREFVENLASKPATQEQKIQLMRDIALEFKIEWDPGAFEKRIYRPPLNAEGQPKTYGSSLIVSNDKSKSSNGKETELGGAKHDVFHNDAKKVATGGQRFQSVKNDDLPKRIEFNYPSKAESPGNGNVQQNGKVEATEVVDRHAGKEVTAFGRHAIGHGKEAAIETFKFGNSSLGKRREQKVGETVFLNGREITVDDAGNPKFLQHKRPDVAFSHSGESLKSYDKKPPHSNCNSGKKDSMNLPEKLREDENRKSKLHHNNSLPPPYVKSSPRVKEYNQVTNWAFMGDDNKCSSSSSSKYIRSIGSPEKPRSEISHSNHEREVAKHDKDYRHNEKDQFYEAALAGIPLPKPRSMRRKHSKSCSNYDVGNVKDPRDMKIKSSSQRRDEKRGLQLLIDEEKHQKDEEERIMDKLLIHYSKKPSKLDPTMGRRKPISLLMGVPPVNEIRATTPVDDEDTVHSPDMVSLPVRSVSLPRQQVGPSEGTEAFARAASFQLDKSNGAKHVHPKLPDYDDLAARFAAMRGR